MHLFRVILPVDEIDRAASFYAELPGLRGERVSPGRHYFNCRGTILACYDPVADGDGKGDGWHRHFNHRSTAAITTGRTWRSTRVPSDLYRP